MGEELNYKRQQLLNSSLLKCTFDPLGPILFTSFLPSPPPSPSFFFPCKYFQQVAEITKSWSSVFTLLTCVALCNGGLHPMG